MQSRASIVCLASAALLAGCVPIPNPHTSVTSPYVDGQITKDGQPLVDRRVAVYPGMPEQCAQSGAQGTTDNEGRFTIDAITKRQLFTILTIAPVDKIYVVSVCVADENGDFYPVWGQSSFYTYQQGIGPLSQRAHLVCALDQDWGSTEASKRLPHGESKFCEVVTGGGACDPGGNIHPMEKGLPGVCPK